MAEILNGALNSFFKKSFFYDKLMNLMIAENEKLKIDKRKFKTDFKQPDYVRINGYMDLTTVIKNVKMTDNIKYSSDVVVHTPEIATVSTNISINRKVNRDGYGLVSSLDYLFPIPKENTNYFYTLNEKYIKVYNYVIHTVDYDPTFIKVYKVKNEFDMINGLHYQHLLTDEELIDVLPSIKEKLEESNELVKTL